MTPDDLARLHARAFVSPPPWSASAFREMLADRSVRLHDRPGGFIMVRQVLDEAEILTLAVDPGQRRRGIGAALVAHAMALARASGATRIFLEVAADNAAARALYARAGFEAAGTRTGYYRDTGGRRIDALILQATL